MSITNLGIMAAAGLVGFVIVSWLIGILRQQKAPPMPLFKEEPPQTSERPGSLSVAELSSSWHRILGVSPEAKPEEIEAAFHGRLAQLDRIRFDANSPATETRRAETERARVNDAYEFIRRVKP